MKILTDFEICISNLSDNLSDNSVELQSSDMFLLSERKTHFLIDLQW